MKLKRSCLIVVKNNQFDEIEHVNGNDLLINEIVYLNNLNLSSISSWYSVI